MYSYIHDPETGGLLLTSSPTKLSLEPRPVYAPELDMLKLNQRWKYLPQTDAPYMWAESNTYIYRGVKVAVLHGGDLYHAPEVEITPEGEKISELLPVDVDGMCLKNEKLLTVIERSTVRRITADYEKYKGTADIFYVAFSGGKDSAVLLDLVKKTLPEGSFVVVFGDTGMEFPDTYKAVRVAESMCRKENIPFYRARSDFSPEESWRMFGPPSRMLRWCCSVHKNAPQVLTLRKLCGGKKFTGFAFVGIRAEESPARSKYKYVTYGGDFGGQWSHNSILKWTSAEVWLYMYKYKRVVFVNESYKKGISRAGCLLCPMGSGRNDYFQMQAYPEGVSALAEIVKSMNERCAGNPKALDEYMYNGGWNARKNGRDINRDRTKQYIEDIEGDTFIIRVINPSSDWQEWIKTLGVIPFKFEYKILENGYEIRCSVVEIRKHMVSFTKFKQIFKKSAYCVSCRVCEANCLRGCISFDYGLHIRDCIHCGDCLKLEEGCLAYRSLRMPYEGVVEMKGKGINQFSNHAPKSEWIKDFFTVGDEYLSSNSLGPEQIRRFRQFLRLSELTDSKDKATEFFSIIHSKYKWDDVTAWGLIFTNLAYNSRQIQWYVDRMTIGREYSRAEVSEMLEAEGLNRPGISSIIYSFGRFCELPMGIALHFGHAGDETLTRTECTITDNRVLLYALYKFAEKCNLPHEIHLPYLFDDSIDRDGPTPVRIFGLKDDDSLPISERSRGIRARLLGLSAAYPQYINATFTNDLQTITLRDKTSQDILNLFRK